MLPLIALTAVIGLLVTILLTAPEGYEDDDGFHYGPVPLDFPDFDSDGMLVLPSFSDSGLTHFVDFPGIGVIPDPSLHYPPHHNPDGLCVSGKGVGLVHEQLNTLGGERNHD